MYKLVYLPIAKKDIDNIIYYIANKLNNKTAARNLGDSFIKRANSILDFPYGSSTYMPKNKLNNEYRVTKIKNFLMFYIIDEENKIITVVRILYKKMDISKILE